MAAALAPGPVAGAAVGLVLVAAAVAARRPDLAVAGVTLICAVALSFLSRRSAPASVALQCTEHMDAPADGPGAVTAAKTTTADVATVPVRITAHAAGAEMIVVSVRVLEQRTRRAVVAGPDAQLPLSVHTVHSGRQELAQARAHGIGADGAWARSGPAVVLRARLQPHARALPFLPLPPAPTGLTGTHDAPRPGDGGEFRDIHPFRTGDRLQRIDWKATARLARRPGDLFVRRTFATSDVDVALVLDDADDVTGMLLDWAQGNRARDLPTSMDLAREAAWSLASAYSAGADQVSFQLLSRLGNAVPRGSGARHRERLRAAITGAGSQERLSRRRTPQVTRGALIVLLSTFLDDEPVRLAELWRAGGHRVLAVDTLPQLRSEKLRRAEQAAARIVLGARADRLVHVQAVGVDLLTWDVSPGARTAALRAIVRTRRR